ncbi:MAG: enoyl-CoA hydratase, partial [Syntrophobacteraceae bacterium]
ARQPGQALRLAKRLFHLAQGKSLEETLEISAAYQSICHHSPEHAQALEDFFARQRKREDRN